MNIKQNKHKQELREDPVMDWILSTKDSVQKNSSKFIGAAIVIVLLFGAGITMKQLNESKQKKVLNIFGNAMIAYQDKNYDKAIEMFSETVSKYGATPQAIYGSYMIGTIFYEQKKYQEAIDWFKKAVTRKNSSQFVSGQALEGLSSCYEILGQNDQAVKYLEDALKDERIKYRHNAIKWKIALLCSTKDVNRAKTLCNEIIADTSAVDYRQKAENLLVTFEVKTAG